MRIKKHPTGNQYALTESKIWVRDLNSGKTPLDINALSSKTDFPIFLENEVENERGEVNPFDPSYAQFKKAVIVSDGHGFEETQEYLKGLKSDVAVIAVNRTLVKWKVGRKIDFFLVNNPYKECMNFMPTHLYTPRCVASTRTFPEFIKKYKSRGGQVFCYSPTPEAGYSSPTPSRQVLDDYRNPVCAGISLAHSLGVKRLLLACCDDSFAGERPAAVKLENGLWTYPQHLVSQRVVGGMLFWYGKIKGVKLADHSSGLVYEEVPYIRREEICKFFERADL